jgi:uncharacterized protein
MNKNDILIILKQNKGQLADFGVSRVGVFGSYVRNEQSSDSDIDILLEFFKDKKNYRNFLGATDLLENALNKKIDAVTNSSLSPHIGPHIKNEVEYA